MKRLILLSCAAVAACSTAPDTGDKDQLDPSRSLEARDPSTRGGQTGDEGSIEDRMDGGLPGSFPLNEANEVIISPAYRSCQVDTECVLVETSCPSCCGRDAVSATLEETYQSAFAASCAGYAGPICDCMVPDVEARCVDHRCVAIPR